MTRSNAKTTRNKASKFSTLLLAGACFIGLSASLAMTPSAMAKTEEYKFTNNTGQKATDLHIKFNKGSLEDGGDEVPNDALPNNDVDDGASTVNYKAGLSGKGVASGDSIVIKIKFQGTTPKVKSAWWTNGNTLDPDGDNTPGKPGTGDYIPNGELKATDKANVWASVAATGDGLYMVMIDGQPFDFQTFPGEMGEQTAQRFAQFITDQWPQYGEVLMLEGPMVEYTGHSYFTDLPNVDIQILQQDSTQELFVDTCDSYLEVFNLVAGQQAQFVVTDPLHEGQVTAIVWSPQLGTTNVNGSFGFCGTLGLAGVNPNRLIGMGPISGGELQLVLPIPPAAAGLELHLQGILRDTCPHECTTNIVSRVVQDG